MANVAELAERALRKIKVLGVNETPDAADLALASDKVRAAHYALQVERVCQWTLSDIPPQMEEPYVMMAAFLVADDFVVPKEPQWWIAGMKQAQAFVNVPYQADTYPCQVDF